MTPLEYSAIAIAEAPIEEIVTYKLADGALMLLHRETPRRVVHLPRAEGVSVRSEVARLERAAHEIQIHASQLIEEWKERTKR